jgi:molybdopterin/thiamine biosynthesis adenylyltransferase
MSSTPAPDRYSRQTLFKPIGKEGQERLQAASVAIIGCGALGSTLANNLCRAGIGRLVIADRDYIDINNLQRQIPPKSCGASIAESKLRRWSKTSTRMALNRLFKM